MGRFLRFPFFAAAVLALFLSSNAFADQLVANGGFETHTFIGWNTSSNFFDEGLNTVGGNPHSGVFSAQLGQVVDPTIPEGMAFLSQNLATTAGGTYSLTFWLENNGVSQGFIGETNEFQISWNGVVIQDIVNSGKLPYTLFTFPSLAATSGSTELKFGFFDQNSFWHLDDVSVSTVSTVVPEPGSMVLLGSGLLAMAGIIRRKLI